mmetsp:Transcript_19065/g.23463  ORF Transcript_19065/g.23463 Transcript_19065/m.23463 type:complete len:112 (+) Transcript_19065:69-404(+)
MKWIQPRLYEISSHLLQLLKNDMREACRFSELQQFQSYFGKADTFISHCWKGSWGDLISACLDGGHSLSRIVWIDIFAVTQHPQMDALQDDLDALQSVIEGVECGTTESAT